MPPLITGQGYQTVPDISPLTQLIGQAVQQKRQTAKIEQDKQKKETAIKIQQAAKTAGAQALRVRGIKDFSTQRKEIAIMAQNAIKRGEDASGFTQALEIQNQDEFNLNLTRIATRAGNADKMIAQGLAEKDQFEDVTDEEGNIIAQKNLRTGQVIADPRAGQKKKLDDKKLKAELELTKNQFDRSSKLRAEIAKTSVDFNKQRGAWGRVQASAKNPSPAGDLALIFNFMKVLDPGSTVREGEFAQVGAAGNLPTQTQRLYEQYATGQKLTSGQRKDVVDRAGKIFASAEKLNKKDVGRILSVGKQFGIKKSFLLGEEQTEEQVDDLTADEAAELELLRQKFPKQAP